MTLDTWAAIFCLFALIGCQPTPVDSADTGQPTPASWPAVQDQSYADPTAWTWPIEDYIATNLEELGHDDFLHGIHELFVFEDRLYLGYGDANLNLGRITPIELRYWNELEPDSVQSDFVVDEEQVDHYRQAGGTLLLPGVDATEDDLLGNVYTLPAAGDWFKSRTLEYAWHVHDIAAIGDTLYACGSGGTLDDYDSSDVNAYVWRSDDDGETFTIDQAYDHPAPPGDNRFTNLLVVDDTLHVYGYASDTASINTFHAFTLGDEGLEDMASLARFFTTSSTSLSPDRGMLVGVSIGSTLTWKSKIVTAEGTETADALEDYTVIDTLPVEDGPTLLLAVEGVEYPSPDTGPWQAVLAVTTDATEVEILLQWSTDVWPQSAAYFHGSLLVGMADGSVWRAEGEGEAEG